ncbi:hypothetical protein Y032_0500g2584 [Ancylostoma ceylanicum]|uniref:Uncharacterized protein n=1 Tax=Ancylostoma ceylanicum TaxID=53326 RepID=A0A016WTR5_9BILA|nr:hypothetical protein Y032_0500g2584 [Ancylostoma ceylanicum]
MGEKRDLFNVHPKLPKTSGFFRIFSEVGSRKPKKRRNIGSRKSEFRSSLESMYRYFPLPLRALLLTVHYLRWGAADNQSAAPRYPPLSSGFSEFIVSCLDLLVSKDRALFAAINSTDVFHFSYDSMH